MTLEVLRVKIRVTFGLSADAEELPERLRGGWIEDDWNDNYVQFQRARPLRKLLDLPSIRCRLDEHPADGASERR